MTPRIFWISALFAAAMFAIGCAVTSGIPAFDFLQRDHAGFIGSAVLAVFIGHSVWMALQSVKAGIHSGVVSLGACVVRLALVLGGSTVILVVGALLLLGMAVHGSSVAAPGLCLLAFCYVGANRQLDGILNLSLEDQLLKSKDSRKGNDLPPAQKWLDSAKKVEERMRERTRGDDD